MLQLAYEDKYDTGILVSGDGDFVPAVRSVQKKKKQVENIFFSGSSSRKLKNFCDKSLELTREILDKFFE